MKVLEDGDLTGGIDDPALKEEMRNQEMENALRQVITRDAVSLALSVDANQITMWAQELLSYQTEEHDDEEEELPVDGAGPMDGYNLDQVDSYLENIARDRVATEEMAKQESAVVSGVAATSIDDVQMQCEEKYLEDLMADSATLPDEVVAEIKAEVGSQLHEKVITPGVNPVQDWVLPNQCDRFISLGKIETRAARGPDGSTTW